MDMLVSDYDGTLYKPFNKTELEKNIDAIKDYRSLNNLFVIATGRSYASIKEQVNKFNIPFDYLICNDGSTIFDNNKNHLYSKKIENVIVSEILKFLKEVNLRDITMYNSYDKTRTLDDIVEVEVLIREFNELKMIRDFLDSYFPYLCASRFHSNAYLRYKCFKDFGIEKLCSIIDVNPKKIITVGNDSNDIEMLQKYDGYKVFDSHINAPGIKTCANVHQLVKKIM